ncbi:MAG: zinc ribbon domain-containing protein [Deltaproteobacteria bacterium]|nr:zinc ribbon domain-containing protein [Deltaproteobacteria bacterium]
MPIYEYKCTKCNKDFECIVLGDDTVTCPGCGAVKVKRKLSACSFKSSGKNGGDYSSSAKSTSSGCSSCSGGSCASCH